MRILFVNTTCMAPDLQNERNMIPFYGHYHRRGLIQPGLPKEFREAGTPDLQIQRSGTRLFTLVDYDGNTNIEEAFGIVEVMHGQEKWAALTGGFQKQLSETEAGEPGVNLKAVFLLNGRNA